MLRSLVGSEMCIRDREREMASKERELEDLRIEAKRHRAAEAAHQEAYREVTLNQETLQRRVTDRERELAELEGTKQTLHALLEQKDSTRSHQEMLRDDLQRAELQQRDAALSAMRAEVARLEGEAKRHREAEAAHLNDQRLEVAQREVAAEQATVQQLELSQQALLRLLSEKDMTLEQEQDLQRILAEQGGALDAMTHEVERLQAEAKRHRNAEAAYASSAPSSLSPVCSSPSSQESEEELAARGRRIAELQRAQQALLHLLDAKDSALTDKLSNQTEERERAHQALLALLEEKDSEITTLKQQVENLQRLCEPGMDVLRLMRKTNPTPNPGSHPHPHPNPEAAEAPADDLTEALNPHPHPSPHPNGGGRLGGRLKAEAERMHQEAVLAEQLLAVAKNKQKGKPTPSPAEAVQQGKEAGGGQAQQPAQKPSGSSGMLAALAGEAAKLQRWQQKSAAPDP
eukprot:TRINITY_DN18252_c0_g1_i3.p1 TRINITY_DN18252_c0_g1~~TRINITY_DN18252_c0_g1_i3.p1  ORF type:complete len:500 (+),score=176.54 TRINITY_DN18252_c0_g1_i3:123-1502(+)